MRFPGSSQVADPHGRRLHDTNDPPVREQSDI
jgi:hypothetical protein